MMETSKYKRKMNQRMYLLEDLSKKHKKILDYIENIQNYLI